MGQFRNNYGDNNDGDLGHLIILLVGMGLIGTLLIAMQICMMKSLCFIHMMR